MNENETFSSSRAISVPRDHVAGYVYFVTCDFPSFPIKIGFAANPKTRLQAVRRSLPYRIITLAIIRGSRRTERQILWAFKSQKMRGEWFERSPLLLETIKRAAAGKTLFDIAPPKDSHYQIKREFEEYRKLSSAVLS